MSRTFALEVQVSKNGTHLKQFSEDMVCTGDDKDVATLLDVLHKAKEDSNQYLTTLVEADKEITIDIGGSVTSHSKRKHENDTDDVKRLAASADAVENMEDDDVDDDVAD